MSTQTQTKERGWIAHAHEVRAILDSRQSQFRRVFKPQPGPFQYLDYDEGRGWHFWHDVVTYEPGSLVMGADQEYGDEIKCPYGKPGDRLWLKEKWAMDQVYDRRHPRHGNDLFTRWYAADDSRAGPTNCNDQRGKWRSSVTMPCWASRLTLEVADVVESLLPAQPAAEAPDPIEVSIDTIRLNHFIVNTCRFQIDMATGETHCRDQKYKTLRDAIDADMGAPAKDGSAVPSTRPDQEIDRLANYIVSLDCGEPRQSQGAVDTAIRMLDTMRARLENLERESVERFSKRPPATDAQVDRFIDELMDWNKRTLPHWHKGPPFEVAKAFDDELREICRRYITGPRVDRPAPLWLAGEIIDFLNGLVEIDRDAVRALFASRVPCNQKLADDPTVQVRAYGLEDKPHDFEVGILGLLNGFVGIDDEGHGLIQMVVDDEDEELLEFRLAVE